MKRITEDDRGREAARPREIQKRGWRDILVRTKLQISEDNIDVVAAGVAFYSLLSIPFLLTAVVSIYGIVADPAQVQTQMSSLQGILPAEAQGLLSDQLGRVSNQPRGALTFALIGSVLLALWSGSKAAKSLMTALNIAYEEREKRGFLKLNLSAILLTLAGVVGAVLAVALVVGIPAIIGQLGLPDFAQTLSNVLRWPLLAAMALMGLAVLYRYGPSRERPRWRWVSVGSIAAGVLWMIGSALFSWYVSSFGNYNETYGSLGAVAIMLMWFYVTSFVVILGAELNSEIEHQTARDTTTGSEVPMGRRGAQVADTLGQIPTSPKGRKKSA